MKIILTLALAATMSTGAAAAQTPTAPKPSMHTITRAEAIASADARFARLDANHDGTVTAGERRAARAAMRAGQDHADRSMTAAAFRERALARFDRLDTNHDGRIDAAEAQAGHRGGHHRPHGDTPAAG